jgi:hypothetical protein
MFDPLVFARGVVVGDEVVFEGRARQRLLRLGRLDSEGRLALEGPQDVRRSGPVDREPVA